MTDRMFRYYRTDFGRIPVRVIHMDLIFDVFDDHSVVTSALTAASRNDPLPELFLDAKNLEIISVGCTERACSHEYDADNNRLIVRFPDPVPPGTEFTLHTKTVCRPTKNVLEGLYYDETPTGAPPQQITQCQQWGFQRLVPCIDDMTAKCTYTTTIIADERYTNLITNGDLTRQREPAGSGRVKVTYENRVTPMATYLFFLSCGTYATFTRECEYPDGRRFSLELLAPPGSDPAIAGQALEILRDAVVWVNLFTGPGRYAAPGTRAELYRMINTMERMKKSGPKAPGLDGLCSRLNALAKKIVPGYAYTGTVYREIAMQNSDFGGMENVGNTTITANRIMPYAFMTDAAYEYLAKVKVHEFYHNLNGSEVTGASPFEIWLNEAVTVHVENQYHAFHFGEDYSRLQDVIALLAPAGGTLALDAGAASLPIEPDGFNDPNDLITAITYNKAPEFVRMIETFMGKEQFVKGLDLYHRRYRHGNATRAQWVEAMEEVSGQEFAGMAEGWLKQTGFPTLSVKAKYDRSGHKVTLRLRQAGERPEKRWVFPVRIAVADAGGHDTAEILLRLEKEEESVTLPSEKPPGFISINRGCSFYGRVDYNPPLEELYLQAERDSDIIGRFLAFSAILDREKFRLIADPSAMPDKACTNLWYQCLSDPVLMERAGAQFLTIFESVPDPRYAHNYHALWEVRERILSAIAGRHSAGLLEIYTAHLGPGGHRGNLGHEVAAIRRRQVKNTALSVLSRLDTPEIQRRVRDQFETATNATDRLVAFGLYLDSSAPDKDAVLDAFEAESQKNPVSWENFLSAVASTSSRDIISLMTRVESLPAFRIEQANDQRALYGRFALNRKKSLQTEEGRAFLQKTLLRLALVNEYSTVSMLAVFGPLDALEEADQVPLVGILAALLQKLDAKKTTSVYNTARRILAESGKAVAVYEREKGPVPNLTG